MRYTAASCHLAAWFVEKMFIGHSFWRASWCVSWRGPGISHQIKKLLWEKWPIVCGIPLGVTSVSLRGFAYNARSRCHSLVVQCVVELRMETAALFLSCMMNDRARARASPWKPLVSHPICASQVISIRSQYCEEVRVRPILLFFSRLYAYFFQKAYASFFFSVIWPKYALF